MDIFKHRPKQKTKETQLLAAGTAAGDAESSQVWERQPGQDSPPVPGMSQDTAQSHRETSARATRRGKSSANTYLNI